MKRLKCLAIVGILGIVGCGYSSRDNEVIGQVKKVIKQTPLICPERVDADVSLGVMRNGVGSMSTQDQVFYIPASADTSALKAAADTGALVRITYDVKRVVFCIPDHVVTKVEAVK